MSREVGGEVERGMKIDEHNFAVAHDVGMVSAMGAFGPWALWAVGALGLGHGPFCHGRFGPCHALFGNFN